MLTKTIKKTKTSSKLALKTKAFSKLSKAEKRVAIAKDVIKHLKTGFLQAKQGKYFVPKLSRRLDLTDGYLYKGKDVGRELQDVLQNDTKQCKVCAIGAVFAADVLKRDNFKVDSSLYNLNKSTMIDKAEYFKQDMLDMMEVAFEKKIIGNTICGQSSWLTQKPEFTDIGKKCVKFGKQYKKPAERLEAIMKNIIKNKGEFIP